LPSGSGALEIDIFLDAERASVDPCRRAGDNAESAQAFRRIAPRLSEARAAVLHAIENAGNLGATIHDVCAALTLDRGLPVPPNGISGRLTELRQAGLIYRCGRRAGCAIYRHEAWSTHG